MLSALVLSACAAVTGAGDPNVAATVNGTDVAVADVQTRLEQAKVQPQVAQQLEADTDGAFESQLQAQILSQLVLSEILEQWATDLSVEATEDDVAQERKALVEQLGGEEAFEQAVTESGLSPEDVTLQLRQRVLQEKIAAEVSGDVEVTDDEIATFYEENAATQYGDRATARHILVKSEKEAEEILAEIEDGGDFAALAEERSTDTGSAPQGGELPEFGRGQMVPQFEEAVFAGQPGDILGPVETEFGFHIIEVLDLKPGQELEEASDEIRAQLEEQKQGELLQERLTQRTTETEVTVNPRFGTWNAETGQVEPTKPLGETSETATAPAIDASGAPIPGGEEIPTDEIPTDVPVEAPPS